MDRVDDKALELVLRLLESAPGEQGPRHRQNGTLEDLLTAHGGWLMWFGGVAPVISEASAVDAGGV